MDWDGLREDGGWRFPEQCICSTMDASTERRTADSLPSISSWTEGWYENKRIIHFVVLFHDL